MEYVIHYLKKGKALQCPKLRAPEVIENIDECIAHLQKRRYIQIRIRKLCSPSIEILRLFIADKVYETTTTENDQLEKLHESFSNLGDVHFPLEERALMMKYLNVLRSILKDENFMGRYASQWIPSRFFKEDGTLKDEFEPLLNDIPWWHTTIYEELYVHGYSSDDDFWNGVKQGLNDEELFNEFKQCTVYQQVLYVSPMHLDCNSWCSNVYATPPACIHAGCKFYPKHYKISYQSLPSNVLNDLGVKPYSSDYTESRPGTFGSIGGFIYHHPSSCAFVITCAHCLFPNLDQYKQHHKMINSRLPNVHISREFDIALLPFSYYDRELSPHFSANFDNVIQQSIIGEGSIEGMTVFKVGARTGITFGELRGILPIIKLPNLSCSKQVLVKWKSNDYPFSAGGDSGALYYITLFDAHPVPIAVHRASFFATDNKQNLRGYSVGSLLVEGLQLICNKLGWQLNDLSFEQNTGHTGLGEADEQAIHEKMEAAIILPDDKASATVAWSK